MGLNLNQKENKRFDSAFKRLKTATLSHKNAL